MSWTLVLLFSLQV